LAKAWVLFALAVLLSTGIADAEPHALPAEKQALTWDWPTFRASEYVLIDAIAFSSLACTNVLYGPGFGSS
jgi:hypothetical protein